MDLIISLKTCPTLVVPYSAINNVYWGHVCHENELVANHLIGLHLSENNRNDIEKIHRRKDYDHKSVHAESVTAQHRQQFHEAIESVHIFINLLDGKCYTLLILQKISHKTRSQSQNMNRMTNVSCCPSSSARYCLARPGSDAFFAPVTNYTSIS